MQINGELVEVGLDYLPTPRADHHIMGDIKPYRSMITGEEITSRSKHREHLRMHDCVEIGNDSSLHRQHQALRPPPGLKDRLIENANRFLKEK